MISVYKCNNVTTFLKSIYQSISWLKKTENRQVYVFLPILWLFTQKWSSNFNNFLFTFPAWKTHSPGHKHIREKSIYQYLLFWQWAISKMSLQYKHKMNWVVPPNINITLLARLNNSPPLLVGNFTREAIGSCA